MGLADFEHLLKSAIGLDSVAIGASAIDAAVRQRQRACGLDSDSSYLAALQTSANELQALVEAVVVPETWFFRDPQAFAAMRSIVLQQLERNAGPCRLLSLPCSTGEEPYSMAISLVDAGVPATRFRVDGVDISDRALAHARRGVYGRGSFRSSDLAFVDGYFDSTPGGRAISDRIRRQVEFRRGNVLDASSLPSASYDVVFCRNVMIYFDRATQHQALGVLSRLLAPKGTLFVGPAETALLLHHRFQSIDRTQSFGFRKVHAPRQVPRARARHVATVRATPRRESAHSAAPVPSAPPPAAVGHEEATVRAIEAGMLAADEGRLTEAAALYEDCLRQHGPSAQLLYVLALVRDAAGFAAEAVQLYRKALYLDPHQRDALLHLALLLDTQDNKEEAEILRDRARRLLPPAEVTR